MLSQTAPAIEKRNSKRVSCALPASLSALSSERHEYKEGLIKDIGLGGILFVAGGRKEAVQVGDQVKIAFELPSETKAAASSLKLEGRIVHHATDDAVSLGIQFSDISQKEEIQIWSYLVRNHSDLAASLSAHKPV